MENAEKELFIREMTEQDARDVCSWRYPAPFDVYNTENTAESRASFLDGLHYAVSDAENGPILAFFALGPAAALPLSELQNIYADESYTDLALGLRPDLRGRGYGSAVFDLVMETAAELFPEDGWRVTVACDNEPALRIYRARGFTEICSFCTEILYPDAQERLRIAPKKMLIMIREPSEFSDG